MVLGGGPPQLQRNMISAELIKRGKQPNPVQFGHNVLVIEDDHFASSDNFRRTPRSPWVT